MFAARVETFIAVALIPSCTALPLQRLISVPYPIGQFALKALEAAYIEDYCTSNSLLCELSTRSLKIVSESAYFNRDMHMEFSRRLRQLRVTRGLTQEELADAVGISVLQIRRFEWGTALPKFEVTRQLAVVLQVSADAIVFGDREREPDHALRDRFETLSKMPAHVCELAREVLDALIIRNQFLEKRSTKQ
ncbi:helix-turn-helix domain-containing protein [Burkholderia cepacia]